MKNAFSSHPEDIWTGYRFLDDDHIEVRTADNNTTVYSVIEFSESIASFLTFSNDYIKDLNFSYFASLIATSVLVVGDVSYLIYILQNNANLTMTLLFVGTSLYYYNRFKSLSETRSIALPIVNKLKASDIRYEKGEEMILEVLKRLQNKIDDKTDEQKQKLLNNIDALEESIKSKQHK